MQQVEWNIPANIWAGLNTKYEPTTKQVGPDEFTTGSINYEINPTGSVVKRTDTENYNPDELDEPIKDQFEMIFTSGVRHELVMSDGNLYYTTGDGIFNLAASGFTEEANMEFAAYQNRVYFGNGIDDPQVYDITTTYGGVTVTPPQVKDAGAQPPVAAPTFAADTAGGSVPAGAHTYKVTFLYYGTEESNGGPATGVHTVANPNNTVNLTAIPIGGYGVTARKIYRDNNDGLWTLVKTISNNTATTTSDTAALGTTPIPTDNNEPPIWGLVTQYRDRLWVAGVSDAQSTLYYSDAGLPDIWPTNNFIQCNPKDVINALAVYNDKVVVFGKASFGIILGTTSRDFRYIDISPNIGCSDCRSIQIITVYGVPKLQWLSQYGVYQWDGSNLQLVSDKIDNLLKFNIQQASGAQQKNIQSTAEDFDAGSETPGIDITGIPGTITTHGYSTSNNPVKAWDTQAEWEAGSSLTNIATKDGSNTLKAITPFLPTLASGTLNGLIISGSNLQINTATAFTGESKSGSTAPNVGNNGSLRQIGNTGIINEVAFAIIPPRSGTITNVTIPTRVYGGTPSTSFIKIYSDSLGQPGTEIYSVNATSSAPSSGQYAYTFNQAVSFAMTGGTKYWISLLLTYAPGSYSFGAPTIASSAWSGASTSLCRKNNISAVTTAWTTASYDTGSAYPAVVVSNVPISIAGSYTYVANPLAASGLWTSPTYDTYSSNGTTPTFSQSIGFSAGTTSVATTIQASDDPLMLTGVITQTYNSGSSFLNQVTSLSNKRYWRIVTQLSSTNDTSTPTAQAPTLKWLIAATWISEVIDHTIDIDTLDVLAMTATVPSFASAAITIATSADDITYSAFTALGSAVPLRYSKIRVILTNAFDLTSPTVSLVNFEWSVEATFTSYAISTVTTPAGWGLFQSDYEANGGDVLFEARTAATEGALPAATWFTVTNGVTMGLDLFPWIQWRVTLGAHANEVPMVHSVTINWLTVTGNSIRVASLFYNQVYYLAAAEYSSTTNNIVLYYDREGRWGQFSGLNINTMGMFFGAPYFGDAIEGFLVKWLDPAIVTDGAIEFDVRTKAYSQELIADDKTKMLRHLILDVIDTGAQLFPMYSVDGGSTWYDMVDIVTGETSYTGSSTGSRVKLRFAPVSDDLKWGYDVMIRLYNNDEFPVTIIGMRAKAYVSDRPVLLR